MRYLGFPVQEIQIRSSRDDKFEGGGSPWHGWRWMDRFEKANLDKTDSQPSLRDSIWGVQFSRRRFSPCYGAARAKSLAVHDVFRQEANKKSSAKAQQSL